MEDNDLASLVSPCKRLKLNNETKVETTQKDKNAMEHDIAKHNQFVECLRKCSEANDSTEMAQTEVISSVNLVVEIDRTAEKLNENTRIKFDDSKKDTSATIMHEDIRIKLDDNKIDVKEMHPDIEIDNNDLRKADIASACSGVKVSDLVKFLEKGNQMHTVVNTVTDNCENLDESITSMTSEETDGFNSSLRTVIDLSGACIEDNLDTDNVKSDIDELDNVKNDEMDNTVINEEDMMANNTEDTNHAQKFSEKGAVLYSVSIIKPLVNVECDSDNLSCEHEADRSEKCAIDAEANPLCLQKGIISIRGTACGAEMDSKYTYIQIPETDLDQHVAIQDDDDEKAVEMDEELHRTMEAKLDASIPVVNERVREYLANCENMIKSTDEIGEERYTEESETDGFSEVERDSCAINDDIEIVNSEQGKLDHEYEGQFQRVCKGMEDNGVDNDQNSIRQVEGEEIRSREIEISRIRTEETVVACDADLEDVTESAGSKAFVKSVTNFKSGPLCSSTPVRMTIQKSCHIRGKENEQYGDYPVLKTFKPDTNHTKMMSRSEPLCTSTPVVKAPPQGLRMRDMNIQQVNDVNMEKDGVGKLAFGLRLEKEGQIGNNVDLYMDMINESEIVNVKNDKVFKRTGQKDNKDHKGDYIKRDSKERVSKRDKKLLKDTRKEKFKEYMGPGLTSGVSSENGPDANNSKKQFLKNTNIETCMLTEYKGFGLTGPLPEKHATSNVAGQPNGVTSGHPSVPTNEKNTDNFMTEMVIPPGVAKLFPSGNVDYRPAGTEGMLLGSVDTNAVRNTFSGFINQRPAGTEGLLMNNVPGANFTNKQTSCGINRSDSFNKKVAFNKYYSGPAQNSVPNLHALPQHGILRASQSQGTLTGQQRFSKQPMGIQNFGHQPMGMQHLGGQPMGFHQAGCQSKGTTALQPDEAYPDYGTNQMKKGGNQMSKGDFHATKGDKSDNSSADKSDKLEMMFDPSVLQCEGQLKISAYMNFGLLTVHVVQGRQLSTKWKPTCDSFVKMSLIPDDGKKPKCKTEVIQDSNNPLYDQKFSFELNDEDHSKRLMISVWHRDNAASLNEFLGCMSFGLRHLTNPKKEVNGWYYLLTEDIGRKKHLQVSHRQRPQLKVRNNSNIPSVNKDVWGAESLTLTLHRGKNGYGFSVIEACPVRVGRVDRASPAEAAGLQPADIIIRLNKQNVSRSTSISVAKLIKHSSNAMIVEVQRPRPITYEQLENSQWKNTNNTDHDLCDDLEYDMCDLDNDQSDHTVPQMFTIREDLDDDKENKMVSTMADETLYTTMDPNFASLATSTPLPLLARGHRTVQTSEVRKQEAIHRLLSLELDFIDLMHAGMSRYSRPLRHCILSHSQHAALFQNIEKLTTISEYHVKQMHDNAPTSFTTSEDDTDTSGSSDNHSFMQSIGLIYQSKVHMLCQAYDLYAKGTSHANQLLSDLRRCDDFVRFVQDSPMDGVQPSISAFIYKPVQHVRELYRVIQEIFFNTPSDSPDYNCLKQVVEGLQECITAITNYSCDRVESMSSLTSRDSKVSFTASMKSRSSSARSRLSSASCSSGSSKGQGHLLQTSKSVDTEVMKIQDRLVFSANVPVFQLCQDDRHILFSGDMFKWEGQQWKKIHVFLFTDMILQTMRETDGYLRVLQEPTMLRDIAAMDAQRQQPTEFVLYSEPKVPGSSLAGKAKLSLRAPSTEQKFAWKSLIEQRVFAVRGSMDFYSSTSDVSSSSASAIII